MSKTKTLVYFTLLTTTLLVSSACPEGPKFAILDEEYQNRSTANRTPQWSSNGQIIITNIYDGIIRTNIHGNELGHIPHHSVKEQNHMQYSPSLSPDDRVVYRNYYFNDGGFAFLDFNPFKRELISANIEGTDVNKLSSFGRAINHPVWSPDGSKIAFTTQNSEAGFTNQFGIMTLDDSEIHVLESTRAHSTLVWSNSGERVAYLNYSGMNNESVNLAIDEWSGINPKIIATATGRWALISKPAWAPDDEIIYFAKREQVGDAWLTKLYLSRSDGSDQRMIADLGIGYNIQNIQMTPNGTEMILINDYGIGHTGALYLINIEGANLRKIDFFKGTGERSYHDKRIAASWSLDGTKIVVLHHSIDPVVLFTMNTDGSDARLLIKRENGMLMPGHGEPLPPATILPVDEDLRSTP